GGAAASSACDPSSWINPGDVRHLYRIGRGQFGDVFLASARFQSQERQVAVKMLPLVGSEMIETVLRRFDAALFACQGLKGVSVPLGVSMKNGKVCILSPLYEGSVGGRLAHLPDNRLSLSEALKYATDIAKGVLELHSSGVLSLNLKPCNFLLDSSNDAFVGDHALPLLFSGCKSFLDFKFYIGTPNYMAPEQWSVETRGPLAFETDSWGYACSIVEMVTGKRPWEDKTPQEIYNLVVLKGDRPSVPSELPAAIQRVLEDCFEYDYRNRPDFRQILATLTSKQTKIGLVIEEDDSFVQVRLPRQQIQSYSCESRKLCLWKNPLQAGDHVTVKKSARRGCWRYTPHNAEGVVVEVDREEIVVRVKFCGSQDLWEGSPDELELVSFGITVGDWVHRLTNEDHHYSGSRPSCVGIVHSIQHDGELQVAFVGCDMLWTGVPTRLAKIQPLRVGQMVRLSCCARGSPRFEWPCKERSGRITRIMPNGCLVLSSSSWKSKERWFGDPAQVELIERKKYRRTGNDLLSSLHWGLMNPMVFALGVLAGVLLG
ncbi:hypothetical protein SELMODRAFT_52199, partial [Selaginella moellendorffii]